MSTFHNQDTTYFKEATLRVSSLEQSTIFYTEVIGLQVIQQTSSSIILGSQGVPRITLLPGTAPSTKTEGLYHIAFLLPSMESLSRWLHHNIKRGTPLYGASDHDVSHAVYLSDPDGNGIEVYADTPSNKWVKKAQSIQMTTRALNINHLLSLSNELWKKEEETILIGHIHLQGREPKQYASFYQTIGMDITFDLGSAVFLSFDGYHHHLAINSWGMRGAKDHQEGVIGIDTIVLVTNQELSSIQTSLQQQGFNVKQQNGSINTVDPLHINLIIQPQGEEE